MPPDFIKESNLWGPLFALGVFLVLVLAGAVVQVVLAIVLRRRKRAAPDALDVQVLEVVRGPAVLFFALLGLFLGFLALTELTTPTFDDLDGYDKWARRGWLVVVIAEVSYLASHLTQVLMAWYIQNIAARTATDLDQKLLPSVRRVLPITIYLIGGLVALDTLNISISPLLAGLGIGGLAVALAVQPTLSNFFAGTYLVTEGMLNEGDFIELEGGPSGYVVDVGWRSTKVRSRYNNLIIIPNSTMVNSIVTNFYSPTPAMNVIVTCGVTYDTDLAYVEKVAVEVTQAVIDESDDAVKDVAPFFGFLSFGDSNIDFWIFFQARDRTGTFVLTSEVIKGLHARFKEEGIEINYPVRKLVYPPSDGVVPLQQSRESVVEHPPASREAPSDSTDGDPPPS